MGTLHFGVAGDCISARTIMANRSEEPVDAKSAWTCLCVCAFVCTFMSGRVPPFFWAAIFFLLWKSRLQHKKAFQSRFVPEKMREGREGRKWSIAALPFWEETGKGWGSEIQEPAPSEQWKSHFNRKRICVKEGRQILLEGSGCDPGRGRDERDAVPNNSPLKPQFDHGLDQVNTS